MTRKTALKAPRKATRTPSATERLAAKSKADTSAEVVKDMTPAQRQKMIAEFEKQLANGAPTLEAATSDLLRVLQAVGLEFVRRYYPTATMAGFHISRYGWTGGPEFHVSIPVPLPE